MYEERSARQTALIGVAVMVAARSAMMAVARGAVTTAAGSVVMAVEGGAVTTAAGSVVMAVAGGAVATAAVKISCCTFSIRSNHISSRSTFMHTSGSKVQFKQKLS